MTPGAAALALVPGLEDGAPPLRLERLAGGTVNDTWRVDSALGRFVLRVDGAAWRRPGVDRERERVLHDAAAAGGLAPRAWRRAPALGAQVSEFLDGRTWEAADLSRPGSLDRLAARLAELHAQPPPPGVAPFDPAASAADYLRRVDPRSLADAALAGAAQRVVSAAQRVARSSDGLAIVHGDLVPSNLLEGNSLWLLDWEYAQLADPIYDLGCLLAYHPELRTSARRMLEVSGLAGSKAAARLAAATEVYEGLGELWLAARGKAGLRA
jgi:thiamine kinase-like enzyme